MTISTLNLARKWRSQRFNTLVGQELVVKILKNSLYSNHFFPVYLFSGQRGCGKTSTARIFAAALNCAQLSTFQQAPKNNELPCGSCDSCNAFFEVRHPDFIEIDAASHTGVDNMRTIIDAAYYLPVLGRKKIYLIDEAHMLSKAAFNALLKLFEEPPLHAHFILATTDPEKIIETVRSRCFTLFFDAIDTQTLAEHLEYLCKQEQIPYASDALRYIARCAEGSARDAINLLETVRFSYQTVDKQAVLQVLGHIDDDQLASLLFLVARGDIQQFLAAWGMLGERIAASQTWQGLLRLIRGMIWHHYGVAPRDIEPLIVDKLKVIPLLVYTACLDELYRMEQLFIRTSDQRGLLEFVLLRLCARGKKNSDGSPQNQSMVAIPAQEVYEELSDDEGEGEDSEEEDLEDDESDEQEVTIVAQPEHKDGVRVGARTSSTEQAALAAQKVSLCRQQFALLPDPIVASMISQVIAIDIDEAHKKGMLHFATHHTFFADTLAQATALWHPVVKAIYGDLHAISYQFDVPINTPVLEKQRIATPVKKIVPEQSQKTATSATSPTPAAPLMRTQFSAAASSYKKVQQPLEKKIDVSDKQRWPLTNRVLNHFPGTVTIVDETHL